MSEEMVCNVERGSVVMIVVISLLPDGGSGVDL